MSRYEVTGIPLDFTALTGRKVGDTIDLDLDSDQEKALIGAGAIRKLPEPKKAKPDGAAKPHS